jgi:hypothetical protein
LGEIKINPEVMAALFPPESTRVSKTEDKKLIFIAVDSIVQHVRGWKLSNAKQRVAVKSIFSGSKAGDMAA